MKKQTNKDTQPIEKSIHKSVLKTIEKANPKTTTQEVVRDVLDRNYVAQVDPDKLPTRGKTNVINKAKSSELHEKGVKKLKKFLKKKGK